MSDARSGSEGDARLHAWKAGRPRAVEGKPASASELDALIERIKLAA